MNDNWVENQLADDEWALIERWIRAHWFADLVAQRHAIYMAYGTPTRIVLPVEPAWVLVDMILGLPVVRDPACDRPRVE